MFEHDFLALFPEIFLTNATIVLLIHGVFKSTSKEDDYPPLVLHAGWLGLLSVLVTIILVAAGAPVTFANPFRNNLIRDNLTYFCQIFPLLSTTSTLPTCSDYFKQERYHAFESIVLISLSTCSMLFMISAYDSIAMYLAIELQSLRFHVIAASKRDSEFSTEAGSKYSIPGAFPSGILSFGCSIVYGVTGIINSEELAKIFAGYEITLFGAQSSGISMGILSIAVGFLSKITAVPSHVWAPDVYEGSPTLVTASSSIAPKISIPASMLRVSISGFYDPTRQQLFLFRSIASMILGALAAMAQKKVKRLSAYSSIGHVGYLSIGFSCGTMEGIQSLLIGIFIYVSMTINASAIVLALRKTRSKYIVDSGALAETNPILAITSSITMFPYAGIPPLAGSRSKFYLFPAALGCGAYSLALIGVVTSVISRFYYIRLVKVMYPDTPKKWILYKPMEPEKSFLPAISFLLISPFLPYPSPLFLVTHGMALSPCCI
nr:NADH dehydrogenase subunit 2 [Ophioglossum vulgatum]UTD44883.1 NADH dehydrogenase subunit 2 [Ophioglossum vulgatum]